MAKITRQKRKGISSVVGAVFMILVMVGALNVMIWTMQQQDRVTETIIEKSNSNLNRLNEDIEISDVRVTEDNKLDMTVTNTGGAAAVIKSIYIVNETAKEQYRYDLDLVIDGRESQGVGENLPLYVKDDTKYSIRLVTEAGNTATTVMTPLSAVTLPMQLYVIPPTVTPKENITLLFTVTNNLTDSELAGGVIPSLDYDLECDPGPNCQLTQHIAPPSIPTIIGKGSTALFKWVYKVDAPDKTHITFNASLTNAKQGNYVTEKAYAKLVDEAQTSFSSEIIVSSTLIHKPEIFLVAANPFGNTASSSNKGLWGVIVANPTSQPMEVRKLAITIFSPRAQSNDVIFESGGGSDRCNPTNVSPSGTNYWSCPISNTLMWKKTGDAFEIEGRSAAAFLAMVNPGSLGGSPDLESFSIEVSVFTSLGQFGKSGYTGSMRNSEGAVANVYLSSTVNSTSTTHMMGSYDNIESGSTIKVNATIANLNTSGDHKINEGTRLIIVVPKGFANVQVLPSGGFSTSTIEHSDGAWHIIGTLNTDLTGASGSAARTIQFSATAPEVPDKRIYMMYILADGESSGATAFPVGPIAEVPVQVVPP